jgi:hypothetical protein
MLLIIPGSAYGVYFAKILGKRDGTHQATGNDDNKRTAFHGDTPFLGKRKDFRDY